MRNIHILTTKQPNMQRLRFTILIVVTLLSIQSFGQQVSDFLLPQPKELIIQEGEFLFPSGRIICDDVTSKDVLKSLIGIGV